MALNKETEDELDNLILELVYQGGMLERGKTINADMFPEARTALHRLILKERRKVYAELRNKVRLAGNVGSGLTAYKGLDDDENDSSFSRLSRPQVEQLLTKHIAQIDSELERSSDDKSS